MPAWIVDWTKGCLLTGKKHGQISQIGININMKQKVFARSHPPASLSL
jgi:hypothetical protein